MGLHQGQGLVGGEGPVLDGVHPGPDGILDGVGGIGVGGHLHAQAVGGLHRHAHLLVGHQLQVRIVPGGSDAAGGHDLDQVRAPAAVLPHPDAGGVGGIDDAQVPARMGEVGVEGRARVPVPGRGAQRLQRHPHPRTPDLAGLDGVLQGDRLVAAADVTDGGEALLQHGGGKDLPVEGPVDGRVGHPVLGGIGAAGQLGGHMDVAVDEARRHRRLVQVDHPGPRGGGKAVADPADPAVMHQDGDIVPRRVGDAVQQGPGLDRHILRMGDGGEAQGCQGRGEGRGRKRHDGTFDSVGSPQPTPSGPLPQVGRPRISPRFGRGSAAHPAPGSTSRPPPR